jgi:sugar phosphate permease
MAYTVGMAAALLALQATPAGATTLQWIAIAALGFTIYGPQMLIGLSGAELVAPGAVGASQGILGWIAYLGAANAGACVSAGMGLAVAVKSRACGCLQPVGRANAITCCVLP